MTAPVVLIRCVMFAYQLLTGDGRIVYSPLYWDESICQQDADRNADLLGVDHAPCVRYQACFEQTK